MTDSDNIDPRAQELFALAAQRICEVLSIERSEAAAVMLALAADALDTPDVAAPESIMSGLRMPRRDAEP